LAELLGDLFPDRGRVLYSGSVKPENAKPFFERLSIDGALVGCANLQAESFSEIVHLAAA
jgi:triosephosphate isomerase